MTTQPNNNPSRIARRAVKQGELPHVAVEKLVTEREKEKENKNEKKKNETSTSKLLSASNVLK